MKLFSKIPVNTFMAIKNRDGTTFRLNGPNPVMRHQDLWDDGSKFTLHNFNHSEEVVLHNFDQKVQEEPTPKPELAPAKPRKKKYQPLEEIQPQEIQVTIKETPVPAADKAAKRKQTPKNVVLLYCMPATMHDSHDPLYNENRVSLTYGPQFTFEAVVTASSDLILQLWTTIPQVTRGSIIYMSQTRRWWKVSEVEKKRNEYLINCMPSSLQPSFATS